MALPPQLLNACTLRDIALTMQLDLDELVALNRNEGWQEDTLLGETDQVALPDRGFAPWLAARLSAHIAASPLLALKKQELIQLLVPIAFGDRTILDTVLARLLYTVQIEDLAVVTTCEAHADLRIREVAAGGEVLGVQVREMPTGKLADISASDTEWGRVTGLTEHTTGGGTVKADMDVDTVGSESQVTGAVIDPL
jgi:hypothetical protein